MAEPQGEATEGATARVATRAVTAALPRWYMRNNLNAVVEAVAASAVACVLAQRCVAAWRHAFRRWL